MGKVVGVIAIKGGVGKTTISSSLASDLVNHHGKKVLLIDANYSAPNLGVHMDVVNPEKTIHDVLSGKAKVQSAIYNRFGVDVIPGSYVYNERINVLKLRDRINSLKKNYDFVILDSSPSLNEEILSTILASDNLFVITTPDYPTLICSMRAAKLAKQRGTPVSGIIINKVREPKFELDSREIESYVEIPVISKIPDDKTSIKALYARIPISVYNKNAPFSKEIDKISSLLTGAGERKSLLKRILKFGLSREEVNREIVKDKFYKRAFS